MSTCESFNSYKWAQSICLSINTFMTPTVVLLLFWPLLVLCKSNVKGLVNHGETCYANALFQLLYHNQDFRGSLDKYLTYDLVQDQNQKLMALQEIFLKMDQETDAVITPDTFKALPDTFEPKTQYDVAEVLQYYQSIPFFDWSPFTIGIKKESLSFSEYFLELFLNVPEIEASHLEHLFNDHFIKGGRRIGSLSDNLIVRIKRVRENNEKNTDTIIVPEFLSLQPYCLEKNIKSLFRLDAFIEHCGACTRGGHYLFYLHHNESGKYFAISDDDIRELDQKEYLDKASKAYLFILKSAIPFK